MNNLKLKTIVISKFIILLIIFIYQSGNAQNVGLCNYKLVNTIKYESIEDNLSGITYNEITNSLFMVQNDSTNIYEVDLDGNLKRKIVLVGFDDTEGIVHISENRFAVTEEKLGKVVFINIDANTTNINYGNADKVQLPLSLGAPFDGDTNDGLEGLTYNAATNEIITTREYKNREEQDKGYFVFTVPSSFPDTDRTVTLRNDEVKIVCETNSKLKQLRDFAGIHYTGSNMLVLSEGEKVDRTKLLIEVDQNCKEVSRLSLSNTDQPEGVTMANDGTIYIASEKNKLYKFEKATAGNGDVNLDGATNLIDAMMILRYSVDLIPVGDCENLRPPDELCLEQADMNCDGNVTLADALLITQCIIGIDNSYCPN